MKGVIFRAFLSHVDEEFGDEFTEQLIFESKLASGGSYTTVGTYDPVELFTMLGNLSSKTGIAVTTLLRNFGEYLFGFLVKTYPDVIHYAQGPFALISTIDNHIHVEVKKLYPEAVLPVFKFEYEGEDCMILRYESERALPDLAEGLLRGCFNHFDQPAEIVWEDISGGKNSIVNFRLRLLEITDG